MSDYHVTPQSWQEKTVEVPTSKSFANRALILAALCKEEVTLYELPQSTDVTKMLEIFSIIGLDVTVNEKRCTIKNSFPDCEQSLDECVLETGDGGTTNRFLLAMLSRGKRKYILKAKGHMLKRPMEGLVDVLNDLGAHVKRDETGIITVQGPTMSKTDVKVDCSQTTQYLTALKLAFYNDSKTSFVPDHLESSLGYVKLTSAVIETFKKSHKELICPVDSSALSYPLALACLHGDIKVENCLAVDPHQADSVIIEHLKNMGARVEQTESGLVCRKSELKGIDIDGGQCPDIVPTLALLASYAKGRTTIRNISILRHKECDRIAATSSILDNFGVDFDLDGDDLIIRGNGNSHNKYNKISNLDVPEDHRMVMVGALYLFLNGGGTISNSEHVAKSYTNFFESLLA